MFVQATLALTRARGRFGSDAVAVEKEAAAIARGVQSAETQAAGASGECKLIHDPSCPDRAKWLFIDCLMRPFAQWGAACELTTALQQWLKYNHEASSSERMTLVWWVALRYRRSTHLCTSGALALQSINLTPVALALTAIVCWMQAYSSCSANATCDP